MGVRFQSVVVEDTWSRHGSLYFLVGHVNLTLGTRPPALGTRLDDGESLTIDFLPPPDLRGIHWRAIEEKTILAMYMNNRAAESLSAGRTDDAYWFAREAIRQDPAFHAAYNTLGVVYQRHGRRGKGGTGPRLRPRARAAQHHRDVEPRAGAREPGPGPGIPGARAPPRRARARAPLRVLPRGPGRHAARATTGRRRTSSRRKSTARPTTTSSTSGWRWRSRSWATRTARGATSRLRWRTARRARTSDLYAAKLHRIKSSRLH